MTEIAIVGAGIAGLAAAWELLPHGIQPIIFERSGRAGGVILTERQEGFLIEGGPDSVLVQKPGAIDLCRELGIADSLVPTLEPRTAFVATHGQLHPLPEASFLGLPTRIQPLLSSPLFSWAAKLRMGAEVLLPANVHDDESIGAFIRRRFGDQAREYLAEPLLAGIHAGDVDRLSVHALFPVLVEAERTHGSVLRALAKRQRPTPSQSAFVSLPGGMNDLVSSLLARLDPSTIHYRASAVGITADGPYTIRFEAREPIRARAVIVAAPAWSAADLIESIDPQLASLCREIPYVSSATVSFGLRREQVRHTLNGHGFVVPSSERHAVMAATWASSKWPHRAPAGHVLIRAFVGGALDPEILDQSDGAVADAALADLAERLGITGPPIVTRVYRWPRASAQYHVGHLARVRSIDERLSRLPGLFLTGSAYRGTGIPDTIADARATAAKVARFLR